MKNLKIQLGVLAIFTCTTLVVFRSLLFSADASDHTVSLPQEIARNRRYAPAPVPAVPASPEVTGQSPQPAERIQQDAPAVTSEPLPPIQENARLRKLLDDSGGAAGDALDRTSRDITSELVTQLRAHDVAVALQPMECRAAGCAVTLEVEKEADYLRAHNIFDGLDQRSPLLRWPGPRIQPPVVHRDGKLIVTMILVRPDSNISF